MQVLQLVTPSPLPFVLRTLGGFGLFRQGEASPLIPAGKPVALLVYLSALPGRTANREQLLNLLWADREPPSGRHALRQTTWSLRQRLGDQALDVGSEQVSLTLALECDRDRFLALVEAGHLDHAVEVYHGEFLGGFAAPGGFAFEHWAEAERQRLQLLFRHAAETVARHKLGQGQFRAARDLSLRVRDTDPFDESGWRLLIEACLAQDDRVSALAEGARLVQLLAGLGRTAEPATRSLLRRVNAQPEEHGAPEEGALVAELVGREREFSTLLQAFQAARRGGARVVSLSAPAGLGKTRLLLDLARRLAASGTSPVYVRAQPGDRDIPGAYLAEVARQLAERPGARGVSPGSAGSLVALDPSISGRFPALPDPATGDDARRRRVSAVAELIEAVAHEQPPALLLDDLHWADAYSRDCLQHAIPHARSAAALVVLAARPGGGLRGVEADQQIELPPLTPEQTEALVMSLGTLPDADWAADFPARLHQASEGSPLLVLETLELALETAALRRPDGSWECPDPKALVALLEAGSALGRRIHQLDRQQRWLLLLLAVAGTPLPAETLVRASGQVPDGAHVNLNALERRGLVAREGTAWAVAHDEIAGRIEEGAEPRQLAAAHGALGKALLVQATDGTSLRSAARHFAAASQGSDLGDVATAWMRRARAAGDARSPRAVLAELLGVDAGDAAVRPVLHGLPWSLRVRHARPWAWAAVVAGLIVTGLVAAMAGSRPEDPGVLIATWAEEPGGQWRMKTHRLTDGDLARGSIALSSFQPTALVSPNRPEGVVRPGTLDTLATTRAYPDSGGLEVVLAVAGQDSAVRLTHRAGDDYGRAWSPDGRYLAIATDRWATKSRSNIALLRPEYPDSTPLRLTHDPVGRDDVPVWSPDGTRLAFLRTGYGTPRRQICLVSVDGQEEHCLRVPAREPLGAPGWIDAVDVTSMFQDSTGSSWIGVLNTLTGAYRELAEGTAFLSQAPGWIACYCRRSAAEPYQQLVFSADRPGRAVRVAPDNPPAQLVLFPSLPSRSHLDRLEIQGAGHPIPVDGSFRLTLGGWDGAGRPIEPLAVRWSSSDTTVAAVGDDGVLHPRRQGGVTITATAGGWRTTSAPMMVGPAAAPTLLRENWQAGITDRWVPFGEPRPFVAATDQGPALAPNGDSTNLSGVYLRERLPTSDGIGVEFDASIPLTSLVWQHLRVQLMSADSLDVGRWDLAMGHLPMDTEVWRECTVGYPESETVSGQRKLNLIAGILRAVPAPAAMGTGRWTRVRLQFFPDGRCGLAIDGTARAVVDRRVPLGNSALLLIYAYSHRTRILVGHLEVWSGVRRDVDWDLRRSER